MSSRGGRALVAAVVTALAASGTACGSGTGTRAGTTASSAARIPAPVDVCPASKTAWRVLGGLSVDAAAAGSGPAVIFANDSGNSPCGWAGLAGQLVTGGHRVAVFSNAADITAVAGQVRLPALYVGARADNYTGGTTQQDALHLAMRGNPNELLQRPGSAHGTALLTGADGPVVAPRVVSFVRRLLG